MTEKEVGKLLEMEAKKIGNQSEFARLHDLPVSYVNDVIHGRRHPGPKILKALGLKAVKDYVER